MRMEKKFEEATRRNFLWRFIGLTAFTGIAGLMTGRLSGKEMVPSVQAADNDSLIIGQANSNTGASTTSLNANTSSPGFDVYTSLTAAPGVAIRAQLKARLALASFRWPVFTASPAMFMTPPLTVAHFAFVVIVSASPARFRYPPPTVP